MKLAILALALAAVLSFSPMQKVPEPVLEYNLGACGGQDFNVTHMLISEDKITETWDLAEDSSAEKLNEPVVFNIKKEPEDKEGITKFTGMLPDEKKVIPVNGMFKKDRFIMILMVDGEMGHAFYGKPGSVDDMVKDLDEDFGVCQVLHQIKREEIPEALLTYFNFKPKSSAQ